MTQTYLVVHGDSAIENQPLQFRVSGNCLVRIALAMADAHDGLAHDFEFAPVDTVLVPADKRRIALFRGDQVAQMQGQERHFFAHRVLPRKPVRKVALARAHEDFQRHEFLGRRLRDQFTRLSQPVHRGAVDARDNGGQRIVVVLQTQFLQRLVD